MNWNNEHYQDFIWFLLKFITEKFMEDIKIYDEVLIFLS